MAYGLSSKKDFSTIPLGGGLVNIFESMDNDLNSFVFKRDGANEYIYHCATNGLLYKRDVLTDVESELQLPTTNMKCAGHALNYHADRDSLIFIYQENGLYGIAEFKNP